MGAVGEWIGKIPEITQEWLPVVFLLLMLAVVYLLWRTLQLMPKIKPAEQDTQEID